ncbi:MAG: DUF2513 domain-containing protein, partial [Bosea sp. (in: a-proteobacteria)]
MKRDMDLVRKILLSFDDIKVGRVSQKDLVFDGYSKEQVAFHVEIMKEADLLNHHISRPKASDGRHLSISFDMGLRPTMAGYDFADSVRNPETWRKTKDGAIAAGGWTFDLMKDLAKGLAKKKLEDLTG